MTPDELRRIRHAAGLTQAGAAAMIGASVRAWQEWEGGRRQMPLAKWQLFLIMVNL